VQVITWLHLDQAFPDEFLKPKLIMRFPPSLAKKHAAPYAGKICPSDAMKFDTQFSQKVL
jgi:hypothetical protein